MTKRVMGGVIWAVGVLAFASQDAHALSCSDASVVETVLKRQEARLARQKAEVPSSNYIKDAHYVLDDIITRQNEDRHIVCDARLDIVSNADPKVHVLSGPGFPLRYEVQLTDAGKALISSNLD